MTREHRHRWQLVGTGSSYGPFYTVLHAGSGVVIEMNVCQDCGRLRRRLWRNGRLELVFYARGGVAPVRRRVRGGRVDN